MSELVRNPRVMRKAQNEVRSIIRPAKKVVEEVDLRKLAYLKLVVKEILRLHPPTAFLLPRESRKECQINGYNILPNTRAMINVWAVQRDPRIWGRDAEDFPGEVREQQGRVQGATLCAHTVRVRSERVPGDRHGYNCCRARACEPSPRL